MNKPLKVVLISGGALLAGLLIREAHAESFTPTYPSIYQMGLAVHSATRDETPRTLTQSEMQHCADLGDFAATMAKNRDDGWYLTSAAMNLGQLYVAGQKEAMPLEVIEELSAIMENVWAHPERGTEESAKKIYQDCMKSGDKE